MGQDAVVEWLLEGDPAIRWQVLRDAEPLRLENPTTIVRGDRVTHLVYDVTR